MKAIEITAYGPPEVLQLAERENPQPKDNEILVKIYATAVSSGDSRLRQARPFIVRLFFGLFKPRIPVLGYVLAGEIASTGKSVSRFKVGDRVFGTTDMHFGAYAEYICLPESAVIVTMPEQLSYEEAAAIPFGANTALHFLRQGNISCGQQVLIYGASGALGTAAVQLARHFGAEVTGVCSGANAALVKSLGADKVIDYTTTDFTKSDERYDIIFDTVGKSPFSGSVRSLKEKGFYLRAVHMAPAPILRGLWTSLTSNKKVVGGVANDSVENLLFINKLLKTGELKATIDRSYPLEQIAEAHSYVDTGHKKGNVVISINHPSA